MVTTLHTIEPDFELKAQTILKYIANRSAAIIVITKRLFKYWTIMTLGVKKSPLSHMVVLIFHLFLATRSNPP